MAERSAGAGAADVTAADSHAVRQRAGEHAEQFLVTGRPADHEDLRRVLAERAHRPPEVRRQHGLLEPQPDGAPFAGPVVPVERQPAARALHREHAAAEAGAGTSRKPRRPSSPSNRCPPSTRTHGPRLTQSADARGMPSISATAAVSSSPAPAATTLPPGR